MSRSTLSLLNIYLFIVVVCLVQCSAGLAQSGKRAIALRSGIWQTQDIPVCWENPSETNRQGRQWVREAVTETWQKHSQLRFLGWEACTQFSQGIRIEIAEDWPHVKALGKHLDGVPRGMVLNFTFNDWARSQCYARKEFCIKALAVHEFGHALSFAHEHNREEAAPACQKEAQGVDGDFKVTEYDLYSVMNYCNPKWIGNGKLSALDILGLQQLYGAPQPERVVGLSGALRFQLASGTPMQAHRQGRIYALTRPYPSGTLFQVFITTHQPAYVYSFGFDRLEKTYRIFPHTEGLNAYIDESRPQLVIPDEDHYVRIDATVGTDYFCVLFSHRPLAFDTVMKRIERARGSFYTRLHTVLGSEFLQESDVQHADAGGIDFTATMRERGIVPLIVAIQHTP
jgi:hypothetical protein